MVGWHLGSFEAHTSDSLVAAQLVVRQAGARCEKIRLDHKHYVCVCFTTVLPLRRNTLDFQREHYPQHT